MDPALQARYEAYLVSQAYWNAGLVLLVYGAPQAFAIYVQKGVAKKLIAAAPLLFMAPLFVGLCNPNAYRDGSLVGMYFICPGVPALVYVIATLLGGPVAWTRNRPPESPTTAGGVGRRDEP